MTERCYTCYTLALTASLAAPDCYRRELAKLVAHRKTCDIFRSSKPERYVLTRAFVALCQAHQWTGGDAPYCLVCGVAK